MTGHCIRAVLGRGPSALCSADGSDHTGDVDDSTLIELFRALGDPVRWSVVMELRGGDAHQSGAVAVAGEMGAG